MTRTVSPEAARRTYSLRRFFKILMPTDRTEQKVAPGSYFVNPSHIAEQAGRALACAQHKAIQYDMRALYLPRPDKKNVLIEADITTQGLRNGC